MESGIWTLDTAKKRHRFDHILTARIGQLWQPKQFADLGCGNGQYCAVLKGYGWPVVHGYEGTQGIMSLGIYDDIFTLDLTKRRWVEINYDLVLCLEVGEHIPEEHEQTFIDNVCEFTAKDLILSWAIPGQGGKSHVNEKPNDYIVEQFWKRGFRYDKGTTRDLRRHSSLKWFLNTILAFKNGG